MWFANFVLIDGKMRSLFSMLFGASMLLVIERAVAAGRSAPSVHYCADDRAALVRLRPFLLHLVRRHPAPLRGDRDDRYLFFRNVAQVAARSGRVGFILLECRDDGRFLGLFPVGRCRRPCRAARQPAAIERMERSAVASEPASDATIARDRAIHRGSCRRARRPYRCSRSGVRAVRQPHLLSARKRWR